MGKGVVFSLIAIIVGILVSPHVAPSEDRFALSESSVLSQQKIPFDAIKVYNDEVRIETSGIRYAKVNSNSMAPIITDTSTVLEKVPSSENEISVGDVISFYEPSVDKIVLHAVIDIVAKDSQTLYKTKGTANPEADPWLVPFENVKGVLVGVIK